MINEAIGLGQSRQLVVVDYHQFVNSGFPPPINPSLKKLLIVYIFPVMLPIFLLWSSLAVIKYKHFNERFIIPRKIRLSTVKKGGIACVLGKCEDYRQLTGFWDYWQISRVICIWFASYLFTKVELDNKWYIHHVLSLYKKVVIGKFHMETLYNHR